MNIALSAHETKEELAAQFYAVHYSVLKAHEVWALDSIVKKIFKLTGLYVGSFLSREDGGDQQITFRICCQEIDLLLFFKDGFNTELTTALDADILRLCDVYNIPVATNTATAEVLIKSLKRGDFSKVTH
ncbi:MAG: methylglyoxal synthase [Oscillospiraceae bacterium]|jgi:methylglyoxal synthase|nr:methylglyoxal synthase [Oscillospiraceae bacterium]